MKMVGKTIILLSLLLSGAAHALSIRLFCADADGNPLKEIFTGQQMNVVIVVEDIPDNAQVSIPQLINVKRFTVEKFNTTRLCRSGKVDYIKFSAIAYTDQPGMYQNIRASITIDNQQHHSNAISLEVKKADPNSHKIPKDQNLFIDFTFDKTKVKVHEKIIATLKIYAKPNLRFEIRPDFFKSPVLKHAKQWHSKSSERINGQPYEVNTWQWACYPQSIGTHTLPPLLIDLTIPVIQSVWGGLAQYTNYEQKRIASERISLEVQPIAHMPTAGLVGSHVEIYVRVDPAVCRQKEGVSYIVEIISDGDLENYDFTELSGLPDSVHAFFSRATMQDGTSIMQPRRKKIEFILQPQQPGNIEIPDQVVYYYDPHSGLKKSAKSNSVLLTVLEKNQSADQSQSSSIDVDTEIQEVQQDSLKCYQDDFAVAAHEPQLSWWLFFLICSAFPMGIFTIRTYNKKRKHNHKHNALYLIHKVAHENDRQRLYSILIHFIASRSNISVGSLNQQRLESLIDTLPVLSDQKKEWLILVPTIMQYAFDNNKVSDNDMHIFKQVEGWIEFLDQHL